MTKCPKCSSTTIGGPYYERRLFGGGEALRYRCYKCSYEQRGPTHDSPEYQEPDPLSLPQNGSQ